MSLLVISLYATRLLLSFGKSSDLPSSIVLIKLFKVPYLFLILFLSSSVKPTVLLAAFDEPLFNLLLTSFARINVNLGLYISNETRDINGTLISSKYSTRVFNTLIISFFISFSSSIVLNSNSNCFVIVSRYSTKKFLVALLLRIASLFLLNKSFIHSIILLI